MRTIKFNNKIPTLLTTACAIVMISGDAESISPIKTLAQEISMQNIQNVELHKYCCSCAACTS